MAYVKLEKRPKKKLAEAMAEVERGVKSKRWIRRLSTITTFFRDVINFIGVFFETMYSMEKSDSYRKGSGGGSGDSDDPRGAPQGLDNVREYDHYVRYPSRRRAYIGAPRIVFGEKNTK